LSFQEKLDVLVLNNYHFQYPDMEFSTRSVHRLIEDEGEKRVSEDAANELGEVLEQFAGDVAEEAIAVAEEDGYKTVQRDHVRKALSD
jgi:histone H3/H4